MWEWLRRLELTEPPATQQAEQAPAADQGNAAALEDAGLIGGMASDIGQYLFPDTVYLGVNDPVTQAESEALPSWAAVCDGSEKRGTVRSADGTRDLALEKPEDVTRFLEDAGVAAPRKKADGTEETPQEVEARVKALQGVMMSNGLGTRDELAELVQTVQRVERGELDMERLVMSGHHFTGGGDIHGGDGGITFAQLKGVMEQFPQARGGVKDLMLSACNTIKGGKHDEMYRDIFPNLETTWGYDGIAPSVGSDPKNTSPLHIEAWEQASRGDDPQAVADEAKDKLNAKVKVY
jgi:hypothetical protein